jgi:hypothetical protein
MRAQQVLSSAPQGDGETKLWRAEFLAVLAKKDKAQLEAARSLTLDGLAADPANPRGWTLLCEIEVVLGRNDASKCLDTAFFIGPFDWFVASRRTALSIYLWPTLDSDTQSAAARRLNLLWQTQGLRIIALQAAQTANGRTMLKEAFATDPAGKEAFERAVPNAP